MACKLDGFMVIRPTRSVYAVLLADCSARIAYYSFLVAFFPLRARPESDIGQVSGSEWAERQGQESGLPPLDIRNLENPDGEAQAPSRPFLESTMVA